jgi:hypothetical protein
MAQVHTLTLTEDQLRLLPEMTFVWVDLEAGGPAFLGYSPTFHDGDDVAPYSIDDRRADLCRILALDVDASRLSAELEQKLDTLHVSMGSALEIALDAARLTPGAYSYANYFAKIASPVLEMLMPPWLDGEEFSSEHAYMPVPTGDTITFELTAEHLRLLRALRVDWLERNSLAGINFKRPYGDMTYFELDMADILGVPVHRDEQQQPLFSDEQLRYFHRLHAEMLFALPVLLRHGTLGAGLYQMVDGVWKRGEESER